MPNYCYNVLVVKGFENDIQLFVAKYASEKYGIDFEKVIPLIEHKNESRRTWEKLDNVARSRWSGDTDEERFVEYWFNNGGYEERLNKWETKWQPQISTDVEISHISNNTYQTYYSFDTAWSPCSPLIRKLIQDHPELEFEYSFEEPGCEFKGEIVGNGGDILLDTYQECDTVMCPECDNEMLMGTEELTIVCEECGTIMVRSQSDESRATALEETRVLEKELGLE